MRRSGIRGSTKMSRINGANLPGVLCNRGQNDAEGHSGTTRVPTALWLASFLRDAGIRWTGGHSQLLSVLQFCAKASTPKQPGEKKFELNLGTWLLRCEENRSIEWGPHLLSIILNTQGFRRQLSLSMNLLRRSARRFSSLVATAPQ